MKLRELSMRIPVFRSLSHWLLRVPLIIVFIQQGLSKMPVTQETADAYSVITEDIEAVDIDTEVDFVISNSLMKYFSKK